MSLLRFFFRNISKGLSKKGIYLTKSLNYRNRKQVLDANYDYVRYATLGLCFEEIQTKNIIGNIAEVGVYKGDFAKRLNQLFFDRTLYLFDTFKGFADSDILIDQKSGYSNGIQDFSNTNLEAVRKKMPFPEKCIFKKGVFPDTAKNLEDNFCFVSLDADLYNPIYQGLNFFYPRLSKGGYVFVHDFNNEEYKGARQAVIKFCDEQKIGFTPIPDSGGTVILTK